MRVAFLNQYYLPSDAPTAQLLSDLAAALAGAGHDVSVVCSRRSYNEPSRSYPPREVLEGVRVLRTWSTGFGRRHSAGRLIDYGTFLAGAARVVLTEAAFDVVVSLTSPPMLPTLGLLAARMSRARAVCWVMDVYPELAFELGVLRPGSPAGRLLRRVAAATLRRSDRVIALGETMARRLETAGAAGVAAVHNWADGAAIRPLGAPARRGGPFVVLYSGNLGMAYEFGSLLRAATILAAREDVRFLVRGEGPRRAELESEIARLGLSNVELRPLVARERLGESLAEGDLHLITLLGGMAGLLVPSKIYGILAAGRPAVYVGPADGEVPAILAEGRCGINLPEGDGEGLAREVARYADDPARVAAEGLRARELFERRFTRERALAQLVALLEAEAEAA